VNGLRVLVADDDDAVRATLVELCKSLGHEVVAEARDGREALDLIESTAPELVLLDIQMPQISGLEAAKLVAEKREVPVLIVTAFADESLMREAARSGAFSYIVKPVSRERLAAAVSTAVARFEDLQKLRGEVGDLKQSLEERKLIERAKGILMRDMGVKEQEAYSWLKRASSHHNLRIGEVARRVVTLETSKAGVG
jgi:AmiR/NasT family two-component response regulator